MFPTTYNIIITIIPTWYQTHHASQFDECKLISAAAVIIGPVPTSMFGLFSLCKLFDLLASFHCSKHDEHFTFKFRVGHPYFPPSEPWGTTGSIRQILLLIRIVACPGWSESNKTYHGLLLHRVRTYLFKLILHRRFTGRELKVYVYAHYFFNYATLK